MIRLDGKAVATDRKAHLQAQIEQFKAARGRAPSLAVVIVGDDPASQIYVKNKIKMSGELGLKSSHIELSSSVSEAEVLETVAKLNRDEAIDGILVQLPLPKQINADVVIESIAPEKDPDGLTTANLGLLFAGRTRVAPCTPQGVMAMLDHYGISVRGKRVVVVGRSNIVGRPMAQMLTNADATVTLCHSKTANLKHHTRDAEIVVVAAGRPHLLGRDDFAKDAVVIDVGMHRPNKGEFAGKIIGDVRFSELEGHLKAASPVPGGVGPMTIQMLIENTVRLALLRK